ncbi:hypothetical protein KW798_02005 [Candidatus Parcubacteria bacterium]|nr:hypothetical protein [Candidatus Parcubacteria bacterium]
MLRRFVYVGILLVAIVGLDMYVQAKTPYPESYTIGSSVSSFKELSARFTDLADKKGALYAFEVLRRAELPPNTDLHLLAHVVGDELYKQQGVAGMQYCTQEFRNACSHTIVIGALTEFGASSDTLKQIDDACLKAPGGLGAYSMCYHGLGHGVFAYYGYSLPETVAFCKKMGTAEYEFQQYHQCVGGAVMELMGGGGHDPELWQKAQERYLSPDHPLAPCDTDFIPDEAKGFCYMYLTPRLFQLAGADLGNPAPSTYAKAFSFCDAVPASTQTLRDACFGGFGKEFIPLVAVRDIRAVDRMSTEQYQLAASYCLLSPFNDGVKACIHSAVEALVWGGENNPTGALRFCTTVSDTNADTCFEVFIQNMHRYMPERTAELCPQLPAKFAARCEDLTIK